MVGLCEPEDTAAALAAVASNQISLLQTYLASGVDVNAFHAEQSSGQQRTLLHVAAFHGCVEVLEYLLGAGADPNIQSPSDACSPLHAACEGASARCYEAIELLLKAGANKEATDQRGRQPIDLLLTTANPGSDAPVEPAQGSCGMHVPREGDEPASSELNKPEYCTDEARMYMFKVADCPHMDPHDWTECPFAHPGEKARRRDPKCYLYTGVACPDFRKGACKRGDRCPFAHGVFECWLHPSRYRTQLCKDAPHCERRVCFFAHQLDELRTPAAADTNLLAAALAIQSGRDAEGAGGGAAAAAAKDEDQGAPSCADKQSSSCGGTPRGPTSPAAPGSSASTPGGSPCANSCGNPAFGGAAAAAGAGAGAPGRAPTAKERALAAITGAAPYKPSPKLAALLAIGGIESELLASLTAAATRANSAASASSDKSPVRGSSSAASTPLQTSSSGGSSASGKRGSGKSSAASTDTDSPGAPQGRGARGRGQRQQQGAGAHGQRGHGASRMLQQQVLQQQQQQRLMQYYATAAATANAAATMAQYREQIQQQQAVLAALQQQQQQMLLSQAAGTSPFGAAAGAGSPWGSSSGLNDMLGMTSAAQDLVLQQQQQQHMGANAAAEALANLQLQSLGLPGGRNGLGSGPFPTSPTSAAAAAAAAAAVSMASRAGSLPAPGGSLGMLGGFSGALPDVLGGGVSASGPLSMLDGGCSSGDWMAPHQALALSRPQLMSGLGMPQGGSYLPNNLGCGGGYTLGNPYAHQMAGGGGLGGMRGGAGGGMGDAGGDWGSNGTWGPGGPLPVGAT